MLWIEIQSLQKSNIICGIVYRQHNSPETIPRIFWRNSWKTNLTNSFKQISLYHGGLQHKSPSRRKLPPCSGIFTFSAKLSIIPTTDKPTRVHNSSTTLIENILTNKVEANITSGNIVSDISDHFHSFVSPTIFLRSRSREKKSAEIFLVSQLIGLTLNSWTHS